MKIFNLEDIAKAVHSKDSERRSIIADSIISTVFDGDAVKIGNDLLCASNVIQLIMDGDNEELKSNIECALGRVLMMDDDLCGELDSIVCNEVNKQDGKLFADRKQAAEDLSHG